MRACAGNGSCAIAVNTWHGHWATRTCGSWRRGRASKLAVITRKAGNPLVLLASYHLVDVKGCVSANLG
eukprot:6201974-Pleurochrysis_carterae.AAC.4